jgi:CHAT domain-containing protein
VIVGDMINDGTHLHERTFGNYSDRARPPLVEPDWNSLRSTVKDKDIIHFVCHGRGENLYLSYAADPGSRLSINQVSQLGFHAGAVVFANACRSATASPLLSDFQSFGRAFYLAGARPYIRTLGPVPQSLAVEFSAMFYSYFALEGLPAAQAMRMTRQQAAKTFKRPVWLFYCLYGNTSVTRRWSAAK